MLAIRFTPVFPIVVAFFAVMAAFELERVIGVKNKAIHIISLIFAGIIPLYYGFNHYLTERGIFIPALAVVILYILLLFILMITDYEHTKFEDVAAVVVASYFVPWGFSTLIMMRDVGVTYPELYDKHYGLFFILLGLFSAWLTDSLAYFAADFSASTKWLRISAQKDHRGCRRRSVCGSPQLSNTLPCFRQQIFYRSSLYLVGDSNNFPYTLRYRYVR